MNMIPPAPVCPLDPELLAAGPAAIAQALRSPDADAEHWLYALAHLRQLDLSAPAREALTTATDRLQALLDSTAAMEAAADALAQHLEPVPV